jgi:hypothetical protein
MFPENQETERKPAEYQRRLIVKTISIGEVAVENELSDSTVEALVSA